MAAINARGEARFYIQGHNSRRRILARRDYTQPTQGRLWTIAQLGNKCARCGFRDARALQIDHVNGGGNKERRDKRIWSVAVLALEDKASGGHRYQLLCANCNWIKRYEQDEVRNALKTSEAHIVSASAETGGEDTPTTPAPLYDSPMVPCACGCGRLVRQFDPSNRERHYIRGHNIRHMIALGRRSR